MRRASAHSTIVPLHAKDDGPPTAPPSVEALVERARRGELAAWTLLYRGHYAGVVRHLCALVGAREVAEDLAQETFARAMTSIASFSGASTFATWLHGVALNVARNHWRAGDRRARAQTQLVLAEATQQLREEGPDREHQRRLRVRVLFTVLDELSANLREAFVLRYVEGLSANEVAQRLEIEPGTVRVRAHRARLQVEQRLQSLGWATAQEVDDASR
ncbi:MAG: sigma-70 family RNA polymerase sigma factor [Deltaproteobacteria bacterium]|nr:sigma-70 family RNA polymerase sigma factor [Deltaproteobacteria bacterium]